MRLTTILNDFRKVGELTKLYSNLPDSYIRRSMEQVFYRTPRLKNYQPRAHKKTKIEFTVDRPWTMQSRLKNKSLKDPRIVYVEPIKDWIFFKGDRVEVLNGPDKGKQGIVMMVVQERNWVLVENLNKKLKIVEKETATRPARIIFEEQPLRVTDQVSLVDPSDLLPCKTEWRYTEKGDKVRVSLRSGRLIPIPTLAKETYDYKLPEKYVDQPKDTAAKVAKKVTFKPTLNTFEMEIMKEMGIEENRVPAPVYWY